MARLTRHAVLLALTVRRSRAHRPRWLYAFFTTIYIVNLLIAKMTTQYETIQNESIYRRKFSRVSVLLEFKDSRSLFPPPLNLIWITLKLLWKPLEAAAAACRLSLHTRRASRTRVVQRGFSEVCGQHKTDQLLTMEKDALEQYKRGVKVHGGPTQQHTRLEELQEEQSRLAEKLRIDHEHTTNRFDRVESSVNHIELLIRALSTDLGSGAAGAVSGITREDSLYRSFAASPPKPTKSPAAARKAAAAAPSPAAPANQAPELTDGSPELPTTAPCDPSPAPRPALAAKSRPGRTAREAGREAAGPGPVTAAAAINGQPRRPIGRLPSGAFARRATAEPSAQPEAPQPPPPLQTPQQRGCCTTVVRI